METILQISKLLDGSKIEHRIIGDHILVRRGKKVKIPKEINEDIAYLCGIICGDGCLDKQLRKDGKFRYRIQISTKNDNHLAYIKQKIKEHFNYEPVISISLHEKSKDILLETSVIYLYFAYLGLPIGEKFGKLSVPSKIRESKKLFSSFLSGFFDTDDSLTSGIYLSQKDVKFLYELKQLIESFYGISIDIKLSPFKLPTGKIYKRYYFRVPAHEFDKIIPFMDFQRLKIK